MKVLLAGACLQPGWTGGEPWVARVLAEGFRERGLEVIEDPALRPPFALAGMGLSPLDWDLPSVHHYRRLIERGRPDIILGFYNYDDSLTRAARELGVPFVASVHIYWPICPIGTLYIEGRGICPGPALGRCVAHMASSLPPTRLPLDLQSLPAPAGFIAYAKSRMRLSELGAAAAVVVPGEHIRRALEAVGYTNLRSIAIGKSVRSIEARDWTGGTKRVLFAAGAPTERKGFHHFEEVARRLRSSVPGVEFVATGFSGSGVVQGLGRLPYDEAMREIGRAYVVVSPSLWNEPFSGAVIEAMASGRPVVAYATGGTPEIVGDTGALVRPGDVDALTEAVRRLLLDEARTRELGRAARQRVERLYDLDHMIDAYVELLRETVARPRHPSGS